MTSSPDLDILRTMIESTPPPSERRLGARIIACTPGSITRADGAERLALIYDLSVSGALLLVDIVRVKVGDPLHLRLYIGEELEEYHSATAKVVRIEELEPEARGPWRRRLAG